MLNQGHCQEKFGYRRITSKLQERGWPVNPKRVQQLMRVRGIVVIYPESKPKQTVPYTCPVY
ncbi:transposase [Paenibacillaceae bacterium]|nr:transposase [Paenibacillaceae bacterium]